MKPERTRPGWYIGPSGEVMIQDMVHDKSHPNEAKRGMKKGLKSILEERGLWREGLRKCCGNESQCRQ
ncbi:hypothetical protein V1525DRAFT_392701 [Lipomyces kononenkoae]|uniref:Uncharacterized protein n=1 Tax=Lipomyces kononenkoae TaxID=34357 RepID=A0ACC3TBJ9_LIPKO